jgi:hypothetical protein
MNCMELNPSRDAASRSATQEFSSILWEGMVFSQASFHFFKLRKVGQ